MTARPGHRSGRVSVSGELSLQFSFFVPSFCKRPPPVTVPVRIWLVASRTRHLALETAARRDRRVEQPFQRAQSKTRAIRQEIPCPPTSTHMPTSSTYTSSGSHQQDTSPPSRYLRLQGETGRRQRSTEHHDRADVSRLTHPFTHFHPSQNGHGVTARLRWHFPHTHPVRQHALRKPSSTDDCGAETQNCGGRSPELPYKTLFRVHDSPARDSLSFIVVGGNKGKDDERQANRWFYIRIIQSLKT